MATWNELDLGGVDAYAAAVKAGYTGTRQEWMTAMQNAEANGLKSEGFATGKQNGVSVESGTYFHDNAQYYKEQAEAANTAAQAAKDAAETAAERDTTAWLNEHITNPDSPPLDRTLSSSSSAAPADMVGSLKSALTQKTDELTIVESDDYFIKYNIPSSSKNDGWKIVSNGTRASGGSSSEIVNYTVTPGDVLRVIATKYTECVFLFAVSSSEFTAGNVIGTAWNESFDGLVKVPSGADVLRISHNKSTQITVGIAGHISEKTLPIIDEKLICLEDANYTGLVNTEVFHSTTSGWKLTYDGGRVADGTSVYDRYQNLTEGEIIHIKATKYTECVGYFIDSLTNWNLKGNVFYDSIDAYVAVPAGATELLISRQSSNNSNSVKRSFANTGIQKRHTNDVNEISETRNAIEYVKGANRYNKNSSYNIDGYYIDAYGRYIANNDYSITHLMEVEPNTTYYQNEGSYGCLYDKNLNILSLVHADGTPCTFTATTETAYYRTSLSNSIKSKFYVSTVNELSDFTDEPIATSEAAIAIQKIIDESSTIDTHVDSVVSKYVNATPAKGNAVISFIDDDGRAEAYTRLYPIMQDKNAPFGVALVTGNIGSTNFLTLAQVQTMFDSGLIETMSHTHNHVQIETLTPEQVDYQCSTSKQWLVDHEFDSQGLVLPHNTSNLSSRRIARQYFDTLYTAYAFNDKGYLDPNQIQRIGFGSFAHEHNPAISGVVSDDDMTYYKAAVDKAIQTNSWLVFMVHVADQPSSADADLEELIDYIQTAGVPILKPKDAFEMKRNQISAGDKDSLYLFMGNNGYATNLSYYQIHEASEIEGGAKIAVPCDKFPPNVVSVIRFNNNSGSGYPGTAGTLETYFNNGRQAYGWSWQKWHKYQSPDSYYRYWVGSDATGHWSDFVQYTAAVT